MVKKKSTENDLGSANLMGTYVWYPLSYPVTYWLLNKKITPNQVSLLSLISCLIGFGFLSLSHTLWGRLIGVTGFLIWSILDCVDGNLARVRKQFSPIGDLWDAAAGYAAICLMFFGIGASGFDHTGRWAYYCVLLGALSGIFTLYPRLLMHFKYHGEDNEVNNKLNYGLAKKIVFNITSPDCLVIPLMYVAVGLKLEFLFTLAYCAMNFVICLYGSYSVLKEEK